MTALSWPSIGFYCLFSIFLFYQRLHLKQFRGESQGFHALLATSAMVGTLTGIAYLLYYGWSVAWWAPIFIFLLGMGAGIASVAFEHLVGALTLSLVGFVGWPISAYFMFKLMPDAG